MAQLVPHRGMYVVFRAGGMRLGVPATSIHEVRSLQALSEQDREALPPQEDLAALFGLPPEPDAQVALVIDMKPARMLRVSLVEEVVDLADAPFFALPQRIRLAVQGAVRGARLLRGGLLLELAPEALVTLVPATAAVQAPLPALAPRAELPERLLVFRTGSARLAAPLAEVSQVVSSPSICSVPMLPDHLWGILHHERSLHVVADASGLAAAPPSPRPPSLAVLVDSAGVPLAVAAERIEGIVPALAVTAKGVTEGGWRLQDAEGPIFLPSYDRLFQHV